MKSSVQYHFLPGVLVAAALLLTGCPQPGTQPAAQTTAAQPAPHTGDRSVADRHPRSHTRSCTHTRV